MAILLNEKVDLIEWPDGYEGEADPVIVETGLTVVTEPDDDGEFTAMREDGSTITLTTWDVRHKGHAAHFTGAWWCDTCDSPYCELA